MADSNGANGRDRSGRFARGNPGGPGNPNLRRLAAYKRAVREAVSADDLRRVLEAVKEQAFAGDLNAAKIIFDRTLGKVVEIELQERVAELERLIETLSGK